MLLSVRFAADTSQRAPERHGVLTRFTYVCTSRPCRLKRDARRACSVGEQSAKRFSCRHFSRNVFSGAANVHLLSCARPRRATISAAGWLLATTAPTLWSRSRNQHAAARLVFR